MDEVSRITNYISSGGLFNPELMEHEKVRDLLISCRDKIKELEAQLEKAESLISMVMDNRKMPHQHLDYFERLCCLTARAHEYFEGKND